MRKYLGPLLALALLAGTVTGVRVHAGPAVVTTTKTTTIVYRNGTTIKAKGVIMRKSSRMNRNMKVMLSNGREYIVEVPKDAVVTNRKGDRVSPADFNKGDKVDLTATWVKKGTLRVKKIQSLG